MVLKMLICRHYALYSYTSPKSINISLVKKFTWVYNFIRLQNEFQALERRPFKLFKMARERISQASPILWLGLHAGIYQNQLFISAHLI